METRQLGNSDLQITPLGFGTFALGGEGWFAAWGPQDDDVSITSIQRPLDLGMNWIDTAAIYGVGHAEEIVARAVKGRSPKQVEGIIGAGDFRLNGEELVDIDRFLQEHL